MPLKLVAFDLDGVLVDHPGSWFSVHHGLGTLDEAHKHERMFHKGLIGYDEWARRDASLWSGIDIGIIKDILSRVPYMAGLKDTLSELASRYKVVIISGGLQILAERVREQFNLDYAVGNELDVYHGVVQGIKQTLAFNDKGKILRHIAMKFNVKTSECAAVGDYLNDLPMFNIAGLSIAFNPAAEECARKANYVVKEKDLHKILSIL